MPATRKCAHFFHKVQVPFSDGQYYLTKLMIIHSYSPRSIKHSPAKGKRLPANPDLSHFKMQNITCIFLLNVVLTLFSLTALMVIGYKMRNVLIASIFFFFYLNKDQGTIVGILLVVQCISFNYFLTSGTQSLNTRWATGPSTI